MSKRRKHIDFATLRDLPVVEVAERLGMPVVRAGSGVWAVKEDEGRDVTSLRLFERKNNWKRFSGIERGGCSAGSSIDLVMHWKDIPFEEAVEWLTSTFVV